jgi:hypothetical protein
MDKANEDGDRTKHAHLSVVGRKEGLSRKIHAWRERGRYGSKPK